MSDLVQRVRSGDIRATSRLITLLEKRDPRSLDALQEIYPYCGRAHVVGITGPPGAGKSCVVSRLIQRFRAKGKSVGVLAVDPSSPFSGGAILGDRVRMIEQSSDKGVFIRSLGSRGSIGGLSAVVNDAVDVLDMAGKDIILIETVGVGQGEIDVSRLAHTVILVLMPGCGDTMQAMKAGIMEIGDILTVNKSDRPGAEETVAELSVVQQLKPVKQGADHWTIPIIKASTFTGEGFDHLEEAIEKHFQFIQEHNLIDQRNRERRTRQFLDILTQSISDEFMAELNADPSLQAWVRKIGNLELDPYHASGQVISMIKNARQSRGGKRTRQ
jgi:LAO/AO transport system kinase